MKKFYLKYIFLTMPLVKQNQTNIKEHIYTYLM